MRHWLSSGGQKYPLHIFLFLVTVFTTLMAGTELVTNRFFFFGEIRQTFDQLYHGIPFSFSFLLFLTVHEFGHYLTARFYGVATSLPYYIPVFIPIFPMNIGSFGAVIRIRQVPQSRRVYFNIGVMGPLAGFVVALGILVYGLLALPPLEPTVLSIHPEYLQLYGGVPTAEQLPEGGFTVAVGTNLLFWILTHVLPIEASQIPPSFELMHYPFVFVGYLVCFFTALNLLPIGQLDGGHVTYGLFGRRNAGIISRVMVTVLLMVGGTGVMRLEVYNPEVYGNLWYYWLDQLFEMGLVLYLYYFVFSKMMPNWGWKRWVGVALLMGGLQFGTNLALGPFESNPIWLIYAFMSARLTGVDHPPALDESPLSPGQKLMGYLAILIFVLCFTPEPMVML